LKALIVYWSRYGNGKRVVNRLNKSLKQKGVKTKVIKTDKCDPARLPEADFYVFSSPTEMFRVQRNMRKFIKKLEGMEGKRYGIINTHCMDRNWLRSMDKVLTKKKKMKKLAAVDFRVGDDAESGDDLPEGWENELDKFAGELFDGC